MEHRKLKICCLICQVDVESEVLEDNIKKAKKSLENYSENDKLDVVLFPEIAFNVYDLKDKKDAKKYSESCGKGKVFEFCVEISKKLNTNVICGYVEICKNERKENKFYNSAYIINRKGEIVLNYRKKLLFINDKRWAEEGESFKTFKLENTEGKEFEAGIAICLDILYSESNSTNQFELADFLKTTDIRAVFFLSAWKDDNEPYRNDEQSISKVIRFWANRLDPVVEEKKRDIAFFCANRVGKEEGRFFCGCSCAIKLYPITIVNNLDKRNEGIMKSQLLI